MNGQSHWQDAEDAAKWLAGKDSLRGLLPLLARLPLLHEKVVGWLDALRDCASVYRSLAQLRGARLVGILQRAWRPVDSPRLYHLSDLGLATVALDQGVEPLYLARHNRLQGPPLIDLPPARARISLPTTWQRRPTLTCGEFVLITLGDPARETETPCVGVPRRSSGSKTLVMAHRSRSD